MFLTIRARSKITSHFDAPIHIDMYDLDKAVETRLTEKIEREVLPRKDLMEYA